MLWTVKYEDVIIELSPSKSVAGRSRYLASSGGQEIRAVRAFGDGLQISYRIEAHNPDCDVYIWVNRFKSQSGTRCIVELRAAIEDSDCLALMSDADLSAWIATVSKALSQAIRQQPEVFLLRAASSALPDDVTIEFALSRLQRWSDLKPSIPVGINIS